MIDNYKNNNHQELGFFSTAVDPQLDKERIQEIAKMCASKDLDGMRDLLNAKTQAPTVLNRSAA
jgi:hypothetical protein